MKQIINSYRMDIANILDVMKTNQKKQFLLKGQQNTHIISKHSDRSIVDDGSSPPPSAIGRHRSGSLLYTEALSPRAYERRAL